MTTESELKDAIAALTQRQDELEARLNTIDPAWLNQQALAQKEAAHQANSRKQAAAAEQYEAEWQLAEDRRMAAGTDERALPYERSLNKQGIDPNSGMGRELLKLGWSD